MAITVEMGVLENNGGVERERERESKEIGDNWQLITIVRLFRLIIEGIDDNSPIEQRLEQMVRNGTNGELIGLKEKDSQLWEYDRNTEREE